MRRGVTWTTFDRARVVCNFHFDEAYRNSFYIYKQFIHPGTSHSNWNQRLQSLRNFGFLGDEELAVNLREDA